MNLETMSGHLVVCVVTPFHASCHIPCHICLWKTRCLKDLHRIDGEPMELEWKIFPGFTTVGTLEDIQKYMTELQCEPEQFKGRIIFQSMYNDIVWREETQKLFF